MTEDEMMLYKLLKDKVGNTWEIESAYRRGYSHGYETAWAGSLLDREEMRKEIRDWKNDEFNVYGAPGTRFEDQVYYYHDSFELDKLLELEEKIDEELNKRVVKRKEEDMC